MSTDDQNGKQVTVRTPAELPALTARASRILLGILVELTEIEVPDGPPRKDTHDN
jgi:hypothetical protein